MILIVLAVLHARSEHVQKIQLRVQFRGLLTRIPCSPASRCEGLGVVTPIADHPSSLRRANALGDTSFFEPYEEVWRRKDCWGVEKRWEVWTNSRPVSSQVRSLLIREARESPRPNGKHLWQRPVAVPTHKNCWYDTSIVSYLAMCLHGRSDVQEKQSACRLPKDLVSLTIIIAIMMILSQHS